MPKKVESVNIYSMLNEKLSVTFLRIFGVTTVVCCCMLNNTRVCDEYLFGQVRTCIGGYQLPIFRCTNVQPRRYSPHSLGMPSLDVVMSHSELTTQLIQCKMHYGRSKKVLQFIQLSEPLNIIK